MLELSDDMSAQAAALTSAPALVLRVDLTAGSIYFADSSTGLPFALSGSLCSVESLHFMLDTTGTLGSEKVCLRIDDTAGTLLQRLENGEFEGVAICLLQCFAGLSADLAVVVFQGRLVQSPRWLEEERQLELEPVSRLLEIAEHQALRTANKIDFPDLDPEDEGRCLPLCFGLPLRIPAVCVKAAENALLTSCLDADDLMFYVDDATRLPQNVSILLCIGSEYMTGVFHSNCCTLSARGDFTASGDFGEPTGSPVILRLTMLNAKQLRLLPGQWITLTIGGKEHSRQIFKSTPGGLVYLTSPFFNINGTYYQPAYNTPFTIKSRRALHFPGAMVRLADAEQIFLLHDGAAGELALVEGETAEGFARVPVSAYSYEPADTTTFPTLGRAVALLRLPTPLTSLPGSPFVNDRVYATFLAAEEAGNPARILRKILTGPLQIAPTEIDEESFTAAAAAREAVRMSFGLTEARVVRKLLGELCVQARLALFCDGGLFKLRTLQNGISSINFGSGDHEEAIVARVSPATVLSGSLTLQGQEEGEPVRTIQGSYQGGEICVTRAGNGVQESIPLWAFVSEAQARIAAEWWLRRRSHDWRTAVFTTFLNGVALERMDTIALDSTLFDTADGSALSAPELRGRVVELRRLPRRSTDEIDAYEVELECPQWTGCASSCESSCEAGSCESGGCEMSCTASCELACQVACQSTLQSYGLYIGPGCTKTCQVSCRTTAERACGSGCEVGCQTECETGCELSCEGQSFETCCPTGCESASESGGVETIRRVRVLSAPAAPGGVASVLSLSGGETFSAIDISDLRPQSGDECTAVLTAGGDWVLTGNGREAKFVRVVAELGGGSYTVIESSPGGGDWGATFTAVLPT